ncbi:MAG TPA: hypothetical protein VIK18_04880, partial [Pirellulales bacterium]
GRGRRTATAPRYTARMHEQPTKSRNFGAIDWCGILVGLAAGASIAVPLLGWAEQYGRVAMIIAAVPAFTVMLVTTTASGFLWLRRSFHCNRFQTQVANPLWELVFRGISNPGLAQNLRVAAPRISVHAP